MPPLQKGVGKKYYNGEYLYNGLDRVDNTKGYIISNIVSCCGQCNRAKGILSQEEFLQWLKRASNYQKF
jgi:hypothetical protein